MSLSAVSHFLITGLLTLSLLLTPTTAFGDPDLSTAGKLKRAAAAACVAASISIVGYEVHKPDWTTNALPPKPTAAHTVPQKRDEINNTTSRDVENEKLRLQKEASPGKIVENKTRAPFDSLITRFGKKAIEKPSHRHLLYGTLALAAIYSGLEVISARRQKGLISLQREFSPRVIEDLRAALAQIQKGKEGASEEDLKAISELEEKVKKDIEDAEAMGNRAGDIAQKSTRSEKAVRMGKFLTMAVLVAAPVGYIIGQSAARDIEEQIENAQIAEAQKINSETAESLSQKHFYKALLHDVFTLWTEEARLNPFESPLKIAPEGQDNPDIKTLKDINLKVLETIKNDEDKSDEHYFELLFTEIIALSPPANSLQDKAEIISDVAARAVGLHSLAVEPSPVAP